MRFKKTILIVSTILAAAFYHYVNNAERVQRLQQSFYEWQKQRTAQNIEHSKEAALKRDYPRAHRYVRYEKIEDKDRAWVASIESLLQNDPNDNDLKEASKFSGNIFDRPKKYESIEAIAQAAFPGDPNGAVCANILGQIDDGNPSTTDDEIYKFGALSRFAVKFIEIGNYEGALFATSCINDLNPLTPEDKEKLTSTLITLIHYTLNKGDLPNAFDLLTKMDRSPRKDTELVPVFYAHLGAGDYGTAIKLLGAVYDQDLQYKLTDELALHALPNDNDGSLLVKIIGQINDDNPATSNDLKFRFDELQKYAVKFAQARKYKADLLLTSSIDDENPLTTDDKEKLTSTLVSLIHIALDNNDPLDAYDLLARMDSSPDKDTELVPVFNAQLDVRDYDTAIKLLGAVYDKDLQYKLTDELALHALPNDSNGSLVARILGQTVDKEIRFNNLQKYAVKFAQARNYVGALLLLSSIDDGNPLTADDKTKLTATLETVIETAFENNDLDDVRELVTKMDPSPKKEAFTVTLSDAYLNIAAYDAGIDVSSWLSHPDQQEPLLEKAARMQLADNDPNSAFNTATFLPPYKSNSIIIDICIYHLLAGDLVKTMERASTLEDPFSRYEITRGVFQSYVALKDFDNAILAASTIEHTDTRMPLIDSIKPTWIGNLYAGFGYSNQMFDASYSGTPFHVRHDIGCILNDKSVNRGALMLNFGLAAIGDREELPGTNIFDESIGFRYLRTPFTLSTDIVQRQSFDGNHDTFFRIAGNYFNTWHGKNKGSETSPNKFWMEHFLGFRWDNADYGGIGEEENLVVEGRFSNYWDFFRHGPNPKRKNTLNELMEIHGFTASLVGNLGGSFDTRHAEYYNNGKASAGFMLHEGLFRLNILGGYQLPFDRSSRFEGPFFEISFTLGGPYYFGIHHSPP